MNIVFSYLVDFEIERNALISLYKSTNGDNWFNNTNWLSDLPLDKWYGIILNDLGYVQVIGLPYNNLIGRLNEELGSIPSSFVNLTNIEFIAFDSNSFEGSLFFLSYYQKLQTIHVYDTMMTGPLEFNSSYLFEVYCAFNYFTGSLLSNSSFNPYLNYFNTDSNYLSGSIPIFENYTALNTINIGSNYISGILCPLNLPENIIYFFVNNNHISGSLTISWDKYVSLKDVYIGANFFTGPFPNLNSSSIEKVNMCSNYLTGRIPEIKNISRFIIINLQDNYFTGSLLHGFDNSCLLEYFYYDVNYMEGEPFNSRYFIELLELLGTIPSSIGNCVHLIYLLGSDNFLTGNIPYEFSKLSEMETLAICENYLSGTLSNTMITYMKALNEMELSNNKLGGALPSALTNKRLLYVVMVNNNLFTGTMPELYSKVILKLDISNNVLTGTIPKFSDLIVYLTAGGNHFLGDLNVDGNLLLSSYEVGDNYLTGPIPLEVSKFSSLNAFYVNSNYLSGTFPSELCILSNLKLLNINDLDMCVPSCLTRAAYSVSSYDFARCQNEQDLALCSIIQQTDVYDKLAVSMEYVTQIYESSHPINDLDNSSYFNLVNISGANKYILSFDIWTDLYSDDVFQICADYACNHVIVSFDITEIPGINGNNPLELFYPFFYINIISFYLVNYFQYWGYLVTVKAYFPLIGWNCTSPTVISQSYDDETLSKYNLTLSNSYAIDICGNNNNWRGIECTFVSVTSLSLESYGISGIIPSSLHLLTALEQLSLSYNSFSGSLPVSIGNLTNLQILDLSNNKLSDEIPSELGQLTQLQYLNLQSNDLIGSMPESLAYLNESLQLMSLSANQLTGKLTNDLCSLSNVSIDVSGNNLICYEECWDHVNGKSLKSGDLRVCAPTSYPTSQPSSPTFQPTMIISSNKSNTLIQLTFILAAILFIVMTFLIYRNFNSKERKLRTIRNKALVKLPIHRYIIEKKSNDELLQILRYSSSTIAKEDYDGHNVIDLAIEYNLSNDIIREILKQLLSIQSDESTLHHDFKYAWIRVIQSDMYIKSVRYVLEVYYSLSRELSDCLDENGRSAVNIASPLCRQAIKESLYFLRRYDFGSNIYPTHVSETSIIYIAIDTLCNDENNKRVAIKFISNKDCFINEIRSRIELSAGKDSIIPILDSYDASTHSHYDFELRRRKLDKYLYCIVMPAGEKNLGNIIATERIAGKDWIQLRVITTQLALSINQLHSIQYIHGDIKPLNVIRLGNEIKLIDLDACAKVGSDYYGSKYSQAYVPPEFVSKNENILSTNRLYFKSLKANYSQDSWSLGMLLYELYTGISFFLKDYDDVIDIESLELLYNFDDEMKQKKLSKISDRFARNLVSLLLDKDPSNRLSISRVLEHPFISGKSALRLEGEEAEYDMFISYRVESDLHYAETINDILTSQGYKVWFDKTSLLPGKNWEEGFSDGLVKSRVLVPIISRNSLNHSTNPRSNVTLLDEESPCDNVLVEYELGLELKERGLITQIYPVLIGDFDHDKREYLDYFSSGCYPKVIKNIIVKSVDKNVSSHLNRLGLGSRMIENHGVKNIIELIFKSQGIVLKGLEDDIFLSIIKDVETMKLSLGFE